MAQWRKLSLFGRLALQWDAIHPYNAGQLMRLGVPIQPDAATDAWNQTLATAALGTAVVDGNWVLHTPGRPAALEQIPPQQFETAIAEQMNRPFPASAAPRAPYAPFRPVFQSDSSGAWLGVFYHHPLADSVSIRLLLQRWAAQLLTPEEASTIPLLHLPDQRRAPFATARGALAALRWAIDIKKARRLPPEGTREQKQQCLLREFPAGTPHHLHELAHSFGAKVGDLLLAAMAIAVHETMPPEHARRSWLALGAIRDTRDPARDPADAFGMRLGFGNLILPPQALSSLAACVATVAAETARHRTLAAQRSSRLGLRILLGAGAHCRRQSLLEFYRKRLPLAAGLSNVNLNNSPTAGIPSLQQFLRISPTGPILPIVFTPTTLQESMSLVVTWRQNVLTAAQAAAMTDRFCQLVTTGA